MPHALIAAETVSEQQHRPIRSTTKSDVVPFDEVRSVGVQANLLSTVVKQGVRTDPPLVTIGMHALPVNSQGLASSPASQQFQPAATSELPGWLKWQTSLP